MSEPQLIDIERLHVKAEWRPRSGGLNIGHVQSLRDSDASDWPPLVVTPDSQHEGDYLVVDGHHRREAGILEQIAALQCIVEETGGLLEAFEANAVHGLPLSREDRRRYAALLHERWPELSLREIGRRAGVSAATVSRVLGQAKALASSEQQPSVSIETSEQSEPAAPSSMPALNKLDEAVEQGLLSAPIEDVVATVERLVSLTTDDLDVLECAGLLGDNGAADLDSGLARAIDFLTALRQTLTVEAAA